MSSEGYIIIKQNEYLRRFRHAGATGPARARTLDDLGIRPSGIFRKMLARDVFRIGSVPETYYLDEPAAEDFVEARRRRLFYMLLLMIVLAAVLFFLARR
jgi:hypothetical protein